MSDMDWDAILNGQEEVDKEFSVIPADTYNVKVSSAEATTSGAGNKMIKLHLEVTSGPYVGRKVFTQIVFTENPKAMRFTLLKLAALGVSKESLRTQKPSNDVLAKMLLHSECQATVSIGEYNEAPSNNVDKLTPSGGPTAAKPPLPGSTGPKPGVPNVPPPPIVDATPEKQVDPPEADVPADPDDEEPF